MKKELKIIFPTEEARHTFASWLSDGGGEQDYFRAMEESATPNLRLSYHPEDEHYPSDDKRRYGKFIEDDTIRVLEIEPDHDLTGAADYQGNRRS